MQIAVAREIEAARHDARIAGRASSPRPDTPTRATALDGVASFAAAAGLAAAWVGAATRKMVAGVSLKGLARAIDTNVQRTVATEVAYAFNDERELVFGELISLQGSGNDDGTPAPRAGAFKVWSAVLDGRTCPRCFAADGETVEVGAKFQAGIAPLHPFCRCIVEYVIVPKVERLEDVAIDYDLFKREMREVIREQRIDDGDRHAVGFLGDSMGKTRSPVALTRRYRNQRNDR